MNIYKYKKWPKGHTNGTVWVWAVYVKSYVQIHPALTITAKLKILQDAYRHCQEGQERQRNENWDWIETRCQCYTLVQGAHLHYTTLPLWYFILTHQTPCQNLPFPFQLNNNENWKWLFKVEYTERSKATFQCENLNPEVPLANVFNF